MGLIGDKLYSRDSTGNIRVWWMEQESNQYRTISGILDGQLVTSEWTVVNGKNLGKVNATTGELQARKEVAARYKKQLKSGYHSNPSEVDTKHCFEPMLAKNFTDYKDKISWEDGVIVQVKFNGHRCIATKDGLYTRTGEKYVVVPHIADDLGPFFDRYPSAILDGELFNHELRQQLNEISKLVRKTVNITNQDLERSASLIKYYVYDGFGFGATSKDDYVKRKCQIDAILLGCTKHVERVDDTVVYSKTELDFVYEEYLKQEQEGVMVRVINSPYENKRSKYLLKYKPVEDAEFTIVDIQEGSGNWAGIGKIIRFRMSNGKEFNGTLKGSREDGMKLLIEKDKWIGKEVTVQFNGLTGLGTPNYARMDIHNCFKGYIS